MFKLFLKNGFKAGVSIGEMVNFLQLYVMLGRWSMQPKYFFFLQCDSWIPVSTLISKAMR